MKSKSAVAFAATLATLLTAGSALAQESVSVIGNNPARACSDAAAVATKTGEAPSKAIADCTAATQGQILTKTELAATYLNRGVVLMARANYDAAIGDFNSALALQSNLPEALVNRGAAYSAQHNYGAAVADFTQALAVGSNQPKTVYFNRALAREDMGDVKGAYLDYRKAAELDPSWALPRQQMARFKVGHAAQS